MTALCPTDVASDPYSQQAQELVERYESLNPENLHESWRALLPQTGALVLDVGAGSGRDARWLAGMGYQVLAVEPSPAMRSAGERLSQGSNVQWLEDALPRLPAVNALSKRFDLVLLSAVWMHLPPKLRATAFATLVQLLASGGKLVFTLRYGSDSHGRTFYPVSAMELQQQAAYHLLEQLLEVRSRDALGRRGVTWETLVFQQPLVF